MRVWLSLAAALLAMQALPALAERDPLSGAPVDPHKKKPVPSPLTDHFYVEGLAFLPTLHTTLRVDGQSPGAGLPRQLGTVVSGEDDLGFKGHSPQGGIEFMIRMRKRHKVRVNYFGSDRQGDQVLSHQILFGDQTFEPADRVTSELEYRTFVITYTYSFVQTERLELGAGLAAHFVEADARGAVAAKNLRQEVSGSGAVPTIPLDFAWRISRRFAFTARANYLRATVNGFQGSVADYHADFQYRWTPNFALGAGYSIMRTSLNINDADFPGMFRLNIQGPALFVRASF